jgi:hypothetical protein
MHVISGFHAEVDEFCALLGRYTTYSDNSLPTFRGNLLVPFQGKEIQEVQEF